MACLLTDDACLVTRLGILAPPIDPITIAKGHDIVVEAKPPDAEGVSGMLLRMGNSFGILYATHIDNPGFQRFSVAHEFGHYLLDGHCEQIFVGDVHVSRAGHVSKDPFEQEADVFAAGLLMPAQMFGRELRRRTDGIETILELKDLFGTSISAAAIRAAELSHGAVAIVVSNGQSVEYCVMSEAMKPFARRGWLKRGDRLPVVPGGGKMVGGQAVREVDLREWFGCERRIEASEEVLGLGNFGRVLTVLTCAPPDDGDEDAEETEEALVERWTPRFSR